MKGQLSIEFLASGLIFIMAVVFVMNSLTGYQPEYLNEKEEESINTEMRRVSDHLIKKEGETNWVSNPSSANNIGLATDYLVISESKLLELDNLNYTYFSEIMDLDHSYNFEFIEIPVIDTSSSFKKGSPSSGIDEPSYSNADENVHYGKREFGSDMYHFLVTAHNGEYDTLYISKGDDNFESTSRLGKFSIGDSFMLDHRYTLSSLQNEGLDKGSKVILSRRITEFGAPLTTGSREIINRFASYEDGGKLDLMRIRVTGW
jgi:hypothetical protein